MDKIEEKIKQNMFPQIALVIVSVSLGLFFAEFNLSLNKDDLMLNLISLGYGFCTLILFSWTYSHLCICPARKWYRIIMEFFIFFLILILPAITSGSNNTPSEKIEIHTYGIPLIYLIILSIAFCCIYLYFSLHLAPTKQEFFILIMTLPILFIVVKYIPANLQAEKINYFTMFSIPIFISVLITTIIGWCYTVHHESNPMVRGSTCTGKMWRIIDKEMDRCISLFSAILIFFLAISTFFFSSNILYPIVSKILPEFFHRTTEFKIDIIKIFFYIIDYIKQI